jgi:hypothetical protein
LISLDVLPSSSSENFYKAAASWKPAQLSKNRKANARVQKPLANNHKTFKCHSLTTKKVFRIRQIYQNALAVDAVIQLKPAQLWTTGLQNNFDKLLEETLLNGTAIKALGYVHFAIGGKLIKTASAS